MKALTLTQPWATLVAIGAKRVETRSWKTNYRGALAIHSAMKFPRDCRDLCKDDPFWTYLRIAGYTLPGRSDIFPSIDADALPRGLVVATCCLLDCRPITPGLANIPGGPTEIVFGDYAPGRFAWILSDVRPLKEPVPAKGSLGLWEWNE